MRFDEAYSGNVFIAASQDYKQSKAVLYGMPMDYTVSFRPGSRFGPARIREVSIGLEEYSLIWIKALPISHTSTRETCLCLSATPAERWS